MSGQKHEIYYTASQLVIQGIIKNLNNMYEEENEREIGNRFGF